MFSGSVTSKVLMGMEQCSKSYVWRRNAVPVRLSYTSNPYALVEKRFSRFFHFGCETAPWNMCSGRQFCEHDMNNTCFPRTTGGPSWSMYFWWIDSFATCLWYIHSSMKLLLKAKLIWYMMLCAPSAPDCRPFETKMHWEWHFSGPYWQQNMARWVSINSHWFSARLSTRKQLKFASRNNNKTSSSVRLNKY